MNMIEVFRRRKRLYLVFEYLDHTVLDELEENVGGLNWERSRRHIFQILRGLDFCHNHKVSEYPPSIDQHDLLYYKGVSIFVKAIMCLIAKLSPLLSSLIYLILYLAARFNTFIAT